MSLRVEKVAERGPCDVIVAEFVFGGMRCLRQTNLTTEDDGETFFICDEHIAAAEGQS